MGSHSDKLYAIYSNGVKKWDFPLGGNAKRSPAIADDGTIYIGCDISNTFYAINSNGTQKWT